MCAYNFICMYSIQIMTLKYNKNYNNLNFELNVWNWVPNRTHDLIKLLLFPLYCVCAFLHFRKKLWYMCNALLGWIQYSNRSFESWFKLLKLGLFLKFICLLNKFFSVKKINCKMVVTFKINQKEYTSKLA